MTRIALIADLHCGHQVGLTHPDFDRRLQTDHPLYKFWLIRNKCWKFYTETMEALQPIDILVVNGDMVDGKGSKSGGTELLTTDRDEQCDMATAAIEVAKVSDVYGTFGTPYHTGVNEDWEKQVAKAVGMARIESVGLLNIKGLIFNYRHHISRSSIPHGRYTSLAKEKLWDMMWAARGEYPDAHVHVRSHVHYHVHCGDTSWLGVITPALQAYGSKIARRTSGVVDYGFIWFDIDSKEDWEWHAKTIKFKKRQRDIPTYK